MKKCCFLALGFQGLGAFVGVCWGSWGAVVVVFEGGGVGLGFRGSRDLQGLRGFS